MMPDNINSDFCCNVSSFLFKCVTGTAEFGPQIHEAPDHSEGLSIEPALDVAFWESHLPHIFSQEVSEGLIHGLRNGVRIGRPPADEIVECPNWPSALEHEDKVSDIIEADLQAGRLYGPFDKPPFDHYIISPLGAIPKRGSDKIRVIHDLSFPVRDSVNSQISKDDFSLKYTSVDEAVKICNKFNPDTISMAKIDLRDAFKHIFIDPADWHLMGFVWNGMYYFSKVLSFGLRSSPALFDVYASALEEIMLRNGMASTTLRYVDDFITICNSESECHSSLQSMLQVCRLAGFDVQPSKIINPCRVVEFLGIVVDAEVGVLRISHERLREIRVELDEWNGVTTTSKRKILSLIGRLAFAARVVRYGRAFLARLIQFSKTLAQLHHRRKLTQEVRLDIDWWQKCIASHNGVYIYNRSWTDGNVCHVYTDSSNLGMGATCCIDGDIDWFAISFTGSFEPCAKMSINWREMLAAVTALKTWSRQLAAKMVVFHIDNDVTCHILNKHYTPVADLMSLVREWCNLAELNDIEIAPVYINTALNVDADDLSRLRISDFLARNPRASKSMTWPLLPENFN
jgi:hypothetical protein